MRRSVDSIRGRTIKSCRQLHNTIVDTTGTIGSSSQPERSVRPAIMSKTDYDVTRDDPKNQPCAESGDNATYIPQDDASDCF